MRKRSDALLERFGLLAKRKVKVKRLSGGEQQRVAIARSLVNDPGIVIADEPTAHLDRALATELANALEALHRDGKTLIIATHDPFLAEQPFVTGIVEMQDAAIVSASRR